MKKNFFAIVIMVLIDLGSCFGQDVAEKTEITLGADLVSRYMWRGKMNSTSPCLQPKMEIAYGGLYFNVWGSYSFEDQPSQELDVTLGWANDFLDISIADYFSPANDPVASSSSYFEYRKGKTGHTLDATLTLTCSERFPLYLTSSVFVYGDDLDDEGKAFYSSYFELGYSCRVKKVTVAPFLGITTGEGFYADRFGVVNAGVDFSKKIKINDQFGIPIGLSLICNPKIEQAFMVFSIGI